MPALCCSVEGTHFERGAFRERYPDDNDSISLSESSSKQKSKMAGYCWVFEFLTRNVSEALVQLLRVLHWLGSK